MISVWQNVGSPWQGEQLGHGGKRPETGKPQLKAESHFYRAL